MIGVFNNIEELWTFVIETLLDDGHQLRSRDGGCLEMTGCHLELYDIESNFVMNPIRNLSPIYAAGEMLWYLSGSNSGEQIRHYAPSYKRYLEPDGTAWGAYGERWKREAQLNLLVKHLQECPETRQAILTMWRPSDLFEATLRRKKDIPCTISLQFLRRAGRLHCITTMRSNDAWFGLPYDIFCFTTLQALLAETLEIEFGTYTHQVGSLHLYDRHVDRAEQALTVGGVTRRYEFYRGPARLPAMLEQAEIWERRLRTEETRFSQDVAKAFATDFGIRTRMSSLMGLAWMQNLPPLTTREEYDTLTALTHDELWMQANEIRRQQKR